MPNSAIPIFIAILIIGILVFIAISITAKKPKILNKEDYQAKWLAIENSLDLNNPSSRSMAILNADKLLDQAMAEVGIVGKTMGDRLKKADSHFSDIQSIWNVHKIRNRIAHEMDFQVSPTTANQAMKIYKEALREIGAI